MGQIKLPAAVRRVLQQTSHRAQTILLYVELLAAKTHTTNEV